MSVASMSARTAISAVFASDANRFFTGDVLSAIDSIKVFQAPQLGHLPNHLGLVPPQSLQVKTVFSLAMARYYCMYLQFCHLSIKSLSNRLIHLTY